MLRRKSCISCAPGCLASRPQLPASTDSCWNSFIPATSSAARWYPSCRASLTALGVAEVWRLPPHGFDTLLAASAETNTHAQWQLANQHARATLHGSMVGGLCGDERFASLLIELGLRLGTTAAAGVTIESPLSRTDIADYLALNPDTLSRISSRFKARGLLLPARSGRLVLPDWKGLCAASPVADTLLALHRARGAISVARK